MDDAGKRIHAKYYTADFSNAAAQADFEKKLFQKTQGTTARIEAEIVMIESVVAVYKSGSDVTMYVVGSAEENELLLASVLDGLYDSLSVMLKDRLDKATLLRNLEFLFLIVDELVDGGIILETDPKALASRVLMKGSDGNDTPVSELTIGEAIATAREHISRTLAKA